MSELGNGTLGDGELSVKEVSVAAGKTDFVFSPVQGQATGKAIGTGRKTGFVFDPSQALNFSVTFINCF